MTDFPDTSADRRFLGSGTGQGAVSLSDASRGTSGTRQSGIKEYTMPAIRYVDVPGYPAAHSPYSHAVVANGFVFVSGQIPVRPGGSPTEVVGDTMQEQTRQALRNVQTILKAAGSSLDQVVKITVLLARPDLYGEMNKALRGILS
jgi:enamine deaminase RidA (YjgF/YER057c/UK114 family)